MAFSNSPPQCLKDLEKPGANVEESIKAILESAGVSKKETFTRLIFSESLASQCMGTPQEDSVIQGIAWVVSNRTLIPMRFGKNVVTAAKQFRSSLGRYDVSRRKEFLCPELEKDWERIWKKAEAAWEETKKPGKNPFPKAYHYYLGKHFENSTLKMKPPAWAKPPAVRVGPEGDCLQVWVLSP